MLLVLYNLWRHQEKRRAECFFLVVFFLFVCGWRSVSISSARYIAPVLIPGVILAVYFVYRFPGALPHGRWRGVASAAVWIAAVISLAVAVFLPFRNSNPKKYLKEFPFLLEGQTGGKTAAVVFLGEKAMDYQLPDTMLKVAPLLLESHDAAALDRRLREEGIYRILEEYFGSVFLISRETDAQGDSPRLGWTCLKEYANARHRTFYRLYRVSGEGRSPETAVPENSARGNLLQNGDLKSSWNLVKEMPGDVRTLREWGIDLGKCDPPFAVPLWWRISLSSGWERKALPILSFVSADNGGWHMECRFPVSFLYNEEPEGGRDYLLLVWRTLTGPGSEINVVSLAWNGTEKNHSGWTTQKDSNGRLARKLPTVFILPGKYAKKIQFGLEFKGTVDVERIHLLSNGRRKGPPDGTKAGASNNSAKGKNSK